MERNFIAESLSLPEDPSPKLIYADWLEERGDFRANVIRAAIRGHSAEQILHAAKIPPLGTFRETLETIELPLSRLLCLAIDCAARNLELFESRRPDDERMRRALDGARNGAQETESRLNDLWEETDEARIQLWLDCDPVGVDAVRDTAWISTLVDRYRSVDALWSAEEALAISITPTTYDRMHQIISRAMRRASAASDDPVGEHRWQIVRLMEYLFWDGEPVLTPAVCSPRKDEVPADFQRIEIRNDSELEWRNHDIFKIGDHRPFTGVSLQYHFRFPFQRQPPLYELAVCDEGDPISFVKYDRDGFKRQAIID
ncbi:MAG: TIGR02996 domain-containing protein, partial [Planctomycetales bacterium]